MRSEINGKKLADILRTGKFYHIKALLADQKIKSRITITRLLEKLRTSSSALIFNMSPIINNRSKKPIKSWEMIINHSFKNYENRRT